MSSSAIVQKLLNYCNVLRDDGMSYGDWPASLMNASAASADPLLRHAFVLRARRSALRRTARVRLRASPLHAPVSRRGLALSPRTAMSNEGSIEQLTYLLFLKMADERTKSPYNQPSQIPDKYSWPILRKRDGDDLFACNAQADGMSYVGKTVSACLAGDLRRSSMIVLADPSG